MKISPDRRRMRLAVTLIVLAAVLTAAGITHGVLVWRLRDALRHGKLAAVRQILPWAPFVRLGNPDSAWALGYAAANGDARLVRLLLRHGVAPDARDVIGGGLPPLHRAIGNDRAEVVRALLDAGADPNTPDPTTEDTPLVRAIEAGAERSGRLLLSYGANVNWTDSHGISTFRYALERTSTLIPELESRGLRRTPTERLWEAVLGRRAGGVRAAIRAGADVRSFDSQGDSILLHAVRVGDAAVVRILIASGADVNDRGTLLFTPLLQAAGDGRTELVRLLLRSGALPFATTNSGQTSLMLASERGHLSTVDYLLRHGALSNPYEGGGAEALELAVREGHPAVARLLRRYGAPEWRLRVWAPSR